MYSEEAIIKRRSKTNKTKNKQGIVKESKTEIIEIKGLSIKSEFKNNEEVIIIKKDDLNQILEKEKRIKEYEEIINNLETNIRDLEEEIIFLNKQLDLKPIPASNNEFEQDIVYSLMLNNSIEEAINIISSMVDSEIKQATVNNIEELEEVYNKLVLNVDKQNNKVKELKKETVNIIDNLNNEISNYNQELQTVSRFKLLFNKDKLFLNIDTEELKETLKEINQLDLINIASFNYITKLLTIPKVNIKNSEVKKELETELNKMKEELKKNNEEEIINI